MQDGRVSQIFLNLISFLPLQRRCLLAHLPMEEQQFQLFPSQHLL